MKTTGTLVCSLFALLLATCTSGKDSSAVGHEGGASNDPAADPTTAPDMAARKALLEDEATSLLANLERHREILITLKDGLRSTSRDSQADERDLGLISGVGSDIESDAAALMAVLVAHHELSNASGSKIPSGALLFDGLVQSVLGAVGTSANATTDPASGPADATAEDVASTAYGVAHDVVAGFQEGFLGEYQEIELQPALGMIPVEPVSAAPSLKRFTLANLPRLISISVNNLLIAVETCIYFFMEVIAHGDAGTHSLPIFSELTFYDVYKPKVDFPTAPGVIRHRNDLYARKLSQPELDALGTDLSLNLIVKAACDNYDRIGGFHLALVPKGSATYSPEAVQRIEVARFITPFMDKNRKPEQVPYHFHAGNLAELLRDPELTVLYDVWAELEVGGTSGAANEQVEGCKDRIDTFRVSAELVTNSKFASSGKPFLLPLGFKRNLNNYAPGESDELGKTAKTIPFNLARPLADAHFYLITSNHGSNAGGEEYNRRWHFVYLDDQLIAYYKPGGVSCEPYRAYNTMANGIYGPLPKPSILWALMSNWCPGQVIPIRDLGIRALSAGNHTFKISVPDAVFAGGQGTIPVSVYLQGTVASSGNRCRRGIAADNAGSGADGACAQCIIGNCLAEAQKSFGNDPNAFGGTCGAYLQCGCGCAASDAACLTGCMPQLNQACQADLAAHNTCVQTRCPAECGVTDRF